MEDEKFRMVCKGKLEDSGKISCVVFKNNKKIGEAEISLDDEGKVNYEAEGNEEFFTFLKENGGIKVWKKEKY